MPLRPGDIAPRGMAVIDPKFADFVETLEQRGEHEVRLTLASGIFYPPDKRHVAVAWLAEREAAAARQADAWRTQEASTARQATAMFKISNTIIVVIAALTLIVTILSWIFPRR